MKFKYTIVLLAASSGWILGQTSPGSPNFEVASVKIHAGPETVNRLAISGSTLMAESYTVAALILEAYNIRNYQLSFAPGISPVELDTVAYDISAKAKDGSAPAMDEFRQMLQTLMADRFQLRVHHESTQRPVYALVVDKGGPKLKESAGEAKSTGGVTVSGRSFQLSFPAIAMADLSEKIRNTSFLDRPVLDRTGLKGTYEVKLIFTPENRINHAESNIGDISIFDAVRQQLGLKLESETSTVDVVVVDHVDKPSPN
jgi:uncharacterized protein (TIGR03435 family)